MTSNETTSDDKVLVGLTHADDDPESVLIALLMGVEAVRADKQAVMWLTKDGVNVALDGFASKIDVPGAPSVAELQAEYVERGGRFYACPVCVKLRDLEGATWVDGTTVAGAPAVYEFTSGGALVFSY
ncbi:MAG: DsrE family protein [Ilumatobacteraceae bacterium]